MSKNNYFRNLPSNKVLKEKLEYILNCKILSINLFPYSSCSPTFRIRYMTNNIVSDIVLRGNPEYHNSVVGSYKPTIKKEIIVHNILLSNNINTATPLNDGEIYKIYLNSSSSSCFEFFLLSFVKGSAIDKNYKINSNYEIYFKRIAKAYYNLHNIYNSQYGIIGDNGSIINPFKNLEDYIFDMLNQKEALLYNNLETDLYEIYKKHVSNQLSFIYSSKNDFKVCKPVLVIYDSSAGNMLFYNNTISMIDLGSTGYFHPIMDFCAFYLTFSSIFFDINHKYNAFKKFINHYKDYGGYLPDQEIFDRLFHIFIINHILSAMIYFKNHRDRNKIKKYELFKRILCNLLNYQTFDNNNYLNIITNKTK
jgi:hypothetical protein